MKKLITAKYIDFLKSEATATLDNKLIHTELERELSRGILDLIDLILELDKEFNTQVQHNIRRELSREE